MSTMLDEAVKHIREAIMLGRTDILKKLLEEVKGSLSKGKKSAIWCNPHHITYVILMKQIQKMEKFNTTTFLMVYIRS